jgi:hypothetical protein
MKTRIALGVAALALLAGGADALAHSKDEPAPRSDSARGLVFRGLERAHPGGPCRTGFLVRLRGGRTGCTHGPDPAPQGRDVRRPRPLKELVAAFGGSGGTTTDGADAAVACFGDGVEGNRVQAVYAYPAGGPDNYEEIAPLIRRWAAIVDQVFNDSAAETGGVRHVRFVTDADCNLDVAKVPLSSLGVESFAGTVDDLSAQGYNRADRKYLVWVDAYVMCGIAGVQTDERPTSDNLNDGRTEGGMFARIDRGCWGWAERSVEAHELAHTLGAVQPGAPNASALFHCVDEADLMCYDDSAFAAGTAGSAAREVAMVSRCPAPHERLLDCNHDDYFHTNPPPQSYLADHWNTAQSSFLTSKGPASVPDFEPPVAAPPVASAHGVLRQRTVPVYVALSATDNGLGIAGYWLWQSTDGGPLVAVSASPLPGSAVLKLGSGHSYSFVVQAVDFSGNLSTAAYGPVFRLDTFQELSASYSPSWRRHFNRAAHRRYQSSSVVRQAVARFRFNGHGVSWVSKKSRRGGKARVYVDGRYVRTVSLYSDRSVARKVVFSRRWDRSGYHTLVLRSVSTRTRPRVSVDAFVVLR